MYQMKQPACQVKDAVELAESLYGLVDVKANQLQGFDDKNFRIKHADRHEYLLKVINTHEAKVPKRYTGMCDMLQALHRRGFNVPRPIKNNANTWISMQYLDDSVEPNLVIMLTFLPGKTMNNIHPSEENFHELITDLAETVAKINIELMAHDYEGWDVTNNFWRLESVTTQNTAHILCMIKDANLRRICSRVVEMFEATVLTKLDQLRSGVIHGDVNAANAIVDKVEKVNCGEFYKLSGLIDFIDMKKSKLVFEVAMMVGFGMCFAQERGFNEKSVWNLMLEGYEKHLNLLDIEKECLYLTVMASLVCYICSATSQVEGTNSDAQHIKYVLRMFDSSCSVLCSLWNDSNQFM